MIPDALDFRYLLAEYYKRIGLDETELAVIIMIEHLIQQGNELITPDLLGLKIATFICNTIKERLWYRTIIMFFRIKLTNASVYSIIKFTPANLQ